MNYISDTYSNILNFFSNTKNRLSELKTESNSFTNMIVNGDFLSSNFLDSIENYPKYPYLFKPIINTSKYNLIKIYYSTDENVDQLLSAITNTNILSLKKKFSSIPDTQINKDLFIQKYFFGNILDDIYDESKFKNLTMSDSYDNYIYNCFSGSTNSSFRDNSFFYLFSIYMILNRNFSVSCNIYQPIVSEINNNLILRNSEFISTFSNYIDSNIDEIADKWLRYLLLYTYNITNPSTAFLNSIKDHIKDKLSEIKNLFSTSLAKKDHIIYNIISWTSSIFYSTASSKFIDYILSSNINLLPTDTQTALINIEKQYYETIMETYTTNSIRPYLYMVYYFKKKPQKFLNVLQMMIYNYISQYLRISGDNSFVYTEVYSYLTKVIGTLESTPVSGLDWDLFMDTINSFFTKEKAIQIINDEKIAEFTFNTFIMENIEQIFSLENSSYDTFLNELFDELFIYLRDTNNLDHTFDYYTNKKMTGYYFKAFFKNEILQGNIFDDLLNMYKQNITNGLTNSLEINFNQTKLKNRTLQYMTANINRIHQFVENIYTTAANRQIHNEHISYYMA